MGKGKEDGFCATLGAAGLCCCVVVVVLFLFGIGIAKIVMGAVHIHDCSIQHLIPVYLIVSGVAPILLGGFGRQGEDDGQGGRGNNMCGTICGVIGFLFNLIWLICGSVWVYPNHAKVMADGFVACTSNRTTNCTVGDCNISLLKFAFGMVTFDWILMGLWVVLLCCILCRACAKS